MRAPANRKATAVDVLLATHHGPGPGDKDDLRWFMKNRLPLGGDMWVGKIENATRIMQDCEPYGLHDVGRGGLGSYYAIGRDNPPQTGNPFQWDPDHRLLMTVAFSRLIHPTALGFDYAARLSLKDGCLAHAFPFPGDKAYTVTDSPLDQQRHWHTRDEWGQIAKLCATWSTCKAQNVTRINSCKWHFENCARMYYMEYRWEALVRSMEALTGNDFDGKRKGGRGARFKQATTRLAAECSVAVNKADVDCAWDARSHVTHGQMLPPPSAPGIAVGDLAGGRPDVYVKVETIIRRTLHRAILDDAFALHFENAASVARWLDSA